MTRRDSPAESTGFRETLRAKPAFAGGVAGQPQEIDEVQNWPKVMSKLAGREGGTTSASRALITLIIGVTGIVSAMYLLVEASYAIFLSVVFGSDILQSSTVEYLAFVGKAAIPAFCFAALCATGLRFWPSGRFWPLGLSAIVVETTLAIYAFVHPESTLLFFV